MKGFFTDRLSTTDPSVNQAIHKEYLRQKNTINLIASENFVSQSVLDAFSIFTNKYAEGYPNKRYYAGCENADLVETLAIERAVEIFKYSYANVQVHSGSQANQAVFLALLSPGDNVLGFSLDAGGHLTHGSKVNLSGKWFNAVGYGVDKDTHLIDMDQVEQLAEEYKPKIIIAGASAYPRHIDFERFSIIAKKVGAVLLADVAHYSGLIAAGVYPSPYPYADVMTTTTHKVLRGPRGGMIMCNDQEMIKKINSAVFPGLQGGPIMQAIAAKAAAFKEVQQPEFIENVHQVVKNAKLLAQSLIEKGFRLTTGGTDSHLMVIDLTPHNITGKQAEESLSSVGVICNKNTIPFDTKSPFITSGIRIGVAAITTRGAKEQHIEVISDIISDTLLEKVSKDDIISRVENLVKELDFYNIENILHKQI